MRKVYPALQRVPRARGPSNKNRHSAAAKVIKRIAKPAVSACTHRRRHPTNMRLETRGKLGRGVRDVTQKGRPAQSSKHSPPSAAFRGEAKRARRVATPGQGHAAQRKITAAPEHCQEAAHARFCSRLQNAAEIASTRDSACAAAACIPPSLPHAVDPLFLSPAHTRAHAQEDSSGTAAALAERKRTQCLGSCSALAYKIMSKGCVGRAHTAHCARCTSSAVDALV